MSNLFSAKTKRLAEAPTEKVLGLTIDGEIPQGSTGSSLDLGIMAAEEEENGVESIPSNLADFLLCNLGKGECGTPL